MSAEDGPRKLYSFRFPAGRIEALDAKVAATGNVTGLEQHRAQGGKLQGEAKGRTAIIEHLIELYVADRLLVLPPGSTAAATTSAFPAEAGPGPGSSSGHPVLISDSDS